MNLRRFLRPEAMRLELNTRLYPDREVPADYDPESERNLDRIREAVIGELAELFEATGEVGNPSRFFKDLYHREKKATTAVGEGIAIPHVRTLQVKSFVMVFARSSAGLPFRAPDSQPVHLFFGLAAPPYDDRTYLKVYGSLARILLEPEHKEEFLRAEEPSGILRRLEVAC